MHVGVATLRRDGFVSLDAQDQPGELVTRPLSFSGSKLFLNADVDKGGSIRVGILTRGGQPLKNYTLDDARPVTGDSTKSPVTWSGSDQLQLADGEHLRLKFRLERARLYAFWVE
jgi:hypothetical protein